MNLYTELEWTTSFVPRFALASLVISALTLATARFAFRKRPSYRSFFLNLAIGSLAALPLLTGASLATGLGWSFPDTWRPASEPLGGIANTLVIASAAMPSSPPSTSAPFADVPASSPWSMVEVWTISALLLTAVWMVGMVIGFARWIGDFRWLQTYLRLSRPLNDLEEERLGRLLSGESFCSVRLSQENSVPFVAGFRHPVIVIPETLWDSLEDDQLAMVLRHEQAHVQHGDHWLLVLQQVARVVHWWNPLIGPLLRHGTLAREELCDHAVVATGNTGTPVRDYKALLVSITERFTRLPVESCTLAMSPAFQRLKQRLLLLDAHSNHNYQAPGFMMKTLLLLPLVLASYLLTCQAQDASDSISIQVHPVLVDNSPPVSLPGIEAADPFHGDGDNPAKQIHITTKFIEVNGEIQQMTFESKLEEQSFDLLPDPKFQEFLQWIAQTKQADVLSAPSIVVLDRQTAKVQLAQQVNLPSSVNPDDVQSFTPGINLEIAATILGDQIHLKGNSTIRQLDDGATAESDVPLSVPDGILALRNLETFFDKVVGEGQTLVIQARKPQNGQGSIFVAITPSEIAVDPGLPMQAADGPQVHMQMLHFGASAQSLLESDWGWLIGANASGTIFESDAAKIAVRGVFTPEQFGPVCSALEKLEGGTLSHLPDSTTAVGSDHVFTLGDLKLAFLPSIGPNGDTIQFQLSKLDASGGETSVETAISLTVWNGQWIVLNVGEPGEDPEILFLRPRLLNQNDRKDLPSFDPFSNGPETESPFTDSDALGSGLSTPGAPSPLDPFAP